MGYCKTTLLPTHFISDMVPRAGVPRPAAKGTILIRDISHLATQNDALGEIADAVSAVLSQQVPFS